MPNIDPGDNFGSFSASNPFSSPSAFSSLTGGVSSIFSGIGDLAEASDYSKAAKLADQNAQITEESTRIQQSQEQRKLFMVTGQQSAAFAGGNLAPSGSAQDVLRSSLQQSALQHQLIGLQGAVSANSFKEQATAYEGQAKAATAAGAGGIVSGILGGIGSFFGV